jgi:outer membrane protein TolC
MKTPQTALFNILFMVISGFLSYGLNAQQVKVNPLTLKEAQEYAVKNHYLVRNSQIDVEIAKKKIWETAAIGLPQVNASIQYQDFLDIPTTLLPDFISPTVYYINENKFGLTPIVPQGEVAYTPVKFGTQHNASIGATLSQLIFNGQYIIGLQATRVFLEYNAENLDKTIIDVRHNVALSYMSVAIQKENRRLLIEGRELVSIC